MFFDDENDSPYNFANFDCSYISPFDKFESEGIIIMSLNIQSINAKFSEFKDLIATLVSNGTVPDIICLQELWNFPPLTNFNLPGYKPLCFKLRSESVQGGGVGLFIKNNLNYTIDSATSVFHDRVLESLFVKISISKQKDIVVGSIYRPGT